MLEDAFDHIGLVGQAAGESDIKRSNPRRPEEWWPWN